jgi:hypothetical protein
VSAQTEALAWQMIVYDVAARQAIQQGEQGAAQVALEAREAIAMQRYRLVRRYWLQQREEAAA